VRYNQAHDREAPYIEGRRKIFEISVLKPECSLRCLDLICRVKNTHRLVQEPQVYKKKTAHGHPSHKGRDKGPANVTLEGERDVAMTSTAQSL